MKILVTGAAGFIGSHLCESLIKEQHEIIALDNFDPFYPRKTKESNIATLQDSKKFQLFEVDLINKNKISQIIKETSPELVIHLAAKAGVRPSLQNPLDYVNTNIHGTVALLEAMKENKLKKIILASSSSIYGENTKVPFSEDDATQSQISVYASTKLAMENFSKMYHNLYHFDVINLRFFTVYGPRQRPDLAIHKFLKANLTGKEITLFGDGSMARDYTFVSDTVQGITQSVKKIMKETNLFKIYNLGNSHPVSLTELIAAIEKVTMKKSLIKYDKKPDGDVATTFADITKAQKELGYSPATPLETGLRSFTDWLTKEI
jgi:UDP-glucuronate 4-epimerase